MGVLDSGGRLCFARAAGFAFGCSGLIHEDGRLVDSGGDARHYKTSCGIGLIRWLIARLWERESETLTH